MRITYEQSTTAADGSATSFAFASPIGQLLCLFLGGIPQLPDDVVVGADGASVELMPNVTPPRNRHKSCPIDRKSVV